jgi:hypothetical protein
MFSFYSYPNNSPSFSFSPPSSPLPLRLRLSHLFFIFFSLPFLLPLHSASPLCLSLSTRPLRTLGTLHQQMALRPEKGSSAVNNRMTDAIKDKYGVKRCVRSLDFFRVPHNVIDLCGSGSVSPCFHSLHSDSDRGESMNGGLFTV